MDGFKTFDETVIKCQNEENYDDCKTRKYVDALKRNCECFPISLVTPKQVELAQVSNRKFCLNFYMKVVYINPSCGFGNIQG